MSYFYLISAVITMSLSNMLGEFYNRRTVGYKNTTQPKGNIAFPVAAGVTNVLLNLAVIILATSELSPSLIYPVLAVGGLAVTMLFSIFAFKEKLKWW